VIFWHLKDLRREPHRGGRAEDVRSFISRPASGPGSTSHRVRPAAGAFGASSTRPWGWGGRTVVFP
jgi:hypothetical protein